MATINKIGIKNGNVYDIADKEARSDIEILQSDVSTLKIDTSSEATTRASYDTSLQNQINELEIQAAGTSEPLAAAAKVRSAKAGGKTCTTLKERCDVDYDELSSEIDDLQSLGFVVVDGQVVQVYEEA